MLKRASRLPLAPALLRGLDILEDLHGQAEDQSVSVIAERLRLPANSTLRLLATLEAKGYVERDPESLKYRLTRKPASLALTGVREQSLMEASLPLMRDLRDATGETILLSIIEHGTGIVLEEIQSLHVFRFVCNSGAYHALHAAAPAKAILATMPKVERNRLLDSYFKGKRYGTNLACGVAVGMCCTRRVRRFCPVSGRIAGTRLTRVSWNKSRPR